ncbi:MAG: cation diffusion facilitator family transporter [Candidatus Kryptoniota bacterium]
MTKDSSREKIGAAVASVIAAVFLSAFKLVVGIATGSLGIMSEAAHSALDLIAAIATLFAVKAADKPADPEHPYGHGKFENVSALFETLLLLLTCVFIGREAIERLLFKKVAVEITVWSFAVMFTSIAVDFTRSRMLSRAAKKFHSQALEADALHFSMDILSSSVVVFGLLGTRIGFTFADPFAALGVSIIVMFISIRLGKRAIDVLVDRSPSRKLVSSIREAALEPTEVEELKSLRVRDSGGKIFVDMVVGLPRLLPFEQAHSLMDEIEKRVRAVRENIDVVVHAEPVATSRETVMDKVRFAADKVEGKIHELEVFSTKTGFEIDLHLEVVDTDTIEAAHKKADALENAIRDQVRNVDHIFVHMDKSSMKPIDATAPNFQHSALPKKLLNFVKSQQGVVGCSNLNFAESESGLRVAMVCQFDETFSFGNTVKIVNGLEESILKKFPVISKVVIHQEPVSHDIRRNVP